MDMNKILNVVATAVNDIERWRGDAYQPPNSDTGWQGDEVYQAIETLKDLLIILMLSQITIQ